MLYWLLAAWIAAVLAQLIFFGTLFWLAWKREIDLDRLQEAVREGNVIRFRPRKRPGSNDPDRAA